MIVLDVEFQAWIAVSFEFVLRSGNPASELLDVPKFFHDRRQLWIPLIGNARLPEVAFVGRAVWPARTMNLDSIHEPVYSYRIVGRFVIPV